MTSTTIDVNQLEKVIIQLLPTLMRQNPQIQNLIVDLARQNFADRQATEDRFYQLLKQLQQNQEDQARKWEEYKRETQLFREEQAKKWEESSRRWEDFKHADQLFREEQAKKWEEFKRETQLFREEQAKKWEESSRRWEDFKHADQLFREEQAKKWEESGRRWEEFKRADQLFREEQAKKWVDTKAEFEKMNQAIVAVLQKQERGITALGARWGIRTENAFRKALKDILEKNFAVQVLNVNEHDPTGEVFGRPEQIELDVIIKNGWLIACEIKSSIDKSGMYAFERKVRFYEKKHQRQADRLIVISPMVDPRALPVAERLEIEIFSDAIDIKNLDGVNS